MPLLLDDGPAATTAGAPGGTASRNGGAASPSGTATPGAEEGEGAPASGTAAAEVVRLKPGTVLALGDGVAARLGNAAPTIVTDPGRLPAVGRAAPLPDTAVLVHVAAGAPAKAAAIAVSATARAAGARAVPVVGTDPRADTRAIEDLSTQQPAHVIAAGSAFGATGLLSARLAVAATGVQLPGGGQVVLPGRRLVAMYGHPGTAGLGVLGEQPLPQAIARAKRLAAPYVPLSGDTPVVPAFELIATVAQANPGVGGDYSFEAPISLLKPWVDAAGKAGMYVVLDLQPGRANFLDQAKLYEPLLKLPHVGLALDPEWRITASSYRCSRSAAPGPRDQLGLPLARRPDRAEHVAAEAVRDPRVPAVDDRHRRAAGARPRPGPDAHPHGRPGPDQHEGRDLGRGRRRGPEGCPVRLEELLRRGHPDAHAGRDDDPEADAEHDLVPVARSAHPAQAVRAGSVPQRAVSGH